MNNKVISMGLILSQLFFGFAGNLANASPITATPEATLLTKVIALSGEKQTAQQVEQKAADALRVYDQAAPAEGREERLQQAFVTLGIYTPSQAENVMAIARDAQARILNTPRSEQNLSTLKVEMANALKQMPQGAQYSACDKVFDAGFVILVGSGIIAAVKGPNSTSLGWEKVGMISGLAIAAVGVAAGIIGDTTGSYCQD